MQWYVQPTDHEPNDVGCPWLCYSCPAHCTYVEPCVFHCACLLYGIPW